jgi:hypothetical protein
MRAPNSEVRIMPRSAKGRTTAVTATRRRKRNAPDGKGARDYEERILREATTHLVLHQGMFLVATAVRQARIKGLPIWIITVTLRYTTGHEGYVGDLLYDGTEFMFLTEQSVMDERVRQIAADPKRLRKWNDYRAAALRAGKG